MLSDTSPRVFGIQVVLMYKFTNEKLTAASYGIVTSSSMIPYLKKRLVTMYEKPKKLHEKRIWNRCLVMAMIWRRRRTKISLFRFFDITDIVLYEPLQKN